MLYPFLSLKIYTYIFGALVFMDFFAVSAIDMFSMAQPLSGCVTMAKVFVVCWSVDLSWIWSELWLIYMFYCLKSIEKFKCWFI